MFLLRKDADDKWVYKKKKKKESVDKNRKGMTDEKAVDAELTGKRISTKSYTFWEE